MNSSTMKTRGRCATVCIADTSGRVCAYCHFDNQICICDCSKGNLND